MDSNFSKHTILATSPISANSIDVLNEKKTKIIVGHSKGLHFLDSPTFVKSTDVKTQQFSGKVTCLTVSDQLVFFACGMQVGAVASNGKIIFRFETFLAAQKIDAIHVCGYRLWLICGELVNQFLLSGVQLSNKKSRLVAPQTQKTEDVNSHMFGSKINHSILCGTQFNKPYLLLLMNSNQIDCFQKKVETTLKTDSPPTCVINYPQNEETVLIGTMNGEILMIQPSRNKIKILWTIQNSKEQGRINCLCLIKNNGFLVCRNKVIQFWNSNKELIGYQQINQKVSSIAYISQNQAVVYGTKNGNIILLSDYEKMIKENANKNQAQQINKLKYQIAALQKQKFQIKKKLVSQGKQINTISVNVKHSLVLDYVKLCYSLQLSSDYKIIKIILKGHITLLQNDNIFYQQIDKQGLNNYIIRGQDTKLVQILLKSDENAKVENQGDYKIFCQVYVQSSQRKADSPGVTVAAIEIDLKPLALYQKVVGKISDFEGKENVNLMTIQGNFKHFEMNLWLNNAFNEFGSAQGDAQNFSQACYESLVNKTKIFIQYKAQVCRIYSYSTTPLSKLKKLVILKSKEKNLNLSYSCQTSDKSVNQLLKKLAPSLQHLEKLRQKFQLLPGLLQLKGQIMSEELQQIQSKSEDIKMQYKRTMRNYEEIKADLMDNYVSYRALNNKTTSEYEIQDFKNKLSKNATIGDWNSIIRMIAQ